MYCSCNGGRRTRCSCCSGSGNNAGNRNCGCSCNCNHSCVRYNPEEVARAAEFVAEATRAFAQNMGDYQERIRESNCARQMVRCMQGRNGNC